MNEQPLRKDLLTAAMHKLVNKVEIKEVNLAAGKAAPKHLHYCPVVGYVAEGSILYQAEGEEARIIGKGEAFYEPENRVILHFDNASANEPLKFIAFYLTEDKEELVTILNE